MLSIHHVGGKGYDIKNMDVEYLCQCNAGFIVISFKD